MSFRIALFFALVLFLSVGCSSTVSPPQAAAPDASGSEARASLDPQEAFAKASTPGEEHKMLQQYAGRWNHTISWWMDPNSPPEVSKGISDIEPIMGGRFISHRVNGVSMGQPFEGLGITGYDNVQKYYSSVWIDNMGTGMMLGKGTFDKSQNAIVDQGSFSCPMSGTGSQSYRAVWTLPVRNSFRYEMYTTDGKGKETKMMEIVYTKAK